MDKYDVEKCAYLTVSMAVEQFGAKRQAVFDGGMLCLFLYQLSAQLKLYSRTPMWTCKHVYAAANHAGIGEPADLYRSTSQTTSE